MRKAQGQLAVYSQKQYRANALSLMMSSAIIVFLRSTLHELTLHMVWSVVHLRVRHNVSAFFWYSKLVDLMTKIRSLSNHADVTDCSDLSYLTYS